LFQNSKIETITANLQGEALVTTPSYLFLIGGIERMFTIGIQISLSIIVYYSVYGNKKLWLYPLAIAVHALVDIPAAAMQVGIIKNVYMVELIVGISAVLLLIAAKKIHESLIAY
jgi:uncharacterized membrane protein YhfC